MHDTTFKNIFYFIFTDSIGSLFSLHGHNHTFTQILIFST